MRRWCAPLSPKLRATVRSIAWLRRLTCTTSTLAIVRAVFGVAETGSLWLTEAQFKVNTLGFLAQHLVVLLDPTKIVGNMHHAYRERANFDARYGVFMTGPSATADIEGVLIHGAQGIRTLTVVPLAEPLL